MNTGLLTSFFVAGLMTLSIYSFSRGVNENTRETVAGANNLNALSETAEVLTNDFNKIGFQATANPINSLSHSSISFVGDIYNNDNFDTTTVRWYWDLNDPVTTTSNPNDFYLKRWGPVSESTMGETKIPVTYFHIKYYSGDGSLTTNRSIVKKMEVEIIMESGEPYRYTADDTPVFHRTAWKRIFLPSNINLLF